MSKARFKFEIMNNLGTILQDEEFKVAYYILNRLALENTNRVKIYRAMLADLTGKSERTISRITDKLHEKEIILKDIVSDSSKRYNYYSIHPNIEQSMTQNEEKLGHEKQETTSNLVMDDRFNNNKKNNKNKKNIIFKRNIKEKIDMNNNEKRLFDINVEELESSSAEDGNSSDDFDYSSMNKEFLKEYEMAIEENLIPSIN